MPSLSRLPFRCLVFLLLVAAGDGFLARPAEGAKRPFADLVAAAARRHGVDPDLVHAVIAVESGYRASAQSPAGAQGLMQLMPGTQRDLGVSDAFDPRQNVDAGVAYLRRLTDEFGTELAIAAYNAGPGDWNDDSDIDVLVIVADGAAERRKALRHLAYDLSLTAEALPAILTRTESEWQQLGEEDSPLRRGIERDGFSVW